MADLSGQDLPPCSDDSRVPTVIAAVTVPLTVATIAVGLRVYTRAIVVSRLGADDYFAIFSLLVAYGTGISIGSMTMFGLGKHVCALDPTNIPLYLRAFYVSIVLYCAGLFGVKMAFMIQYYRILGIQPLKTICLVAMLLIGGWSLSQLFVGIFTCNPVAGFWDASLNATCIPNLPQWYINAAGNIFTDIVVFLFPLPILAKLHVAKRQKYILLGIFSLGFLTVAISVIRIKYLKLFDDFTWENVESSGWSLGELCSGITCACLPTLRPFFDKHFPHLLSRGSTSRSSRGYQNQDSLKAKGSRDLESGTNASNLSRRSGAVDSRSTQQHSEPAWSQKTTQPQGRAGSNDEIELLDGGSSLNELQDFDEQTSLDQHATRVGLHPTVKTKVVVARPSPTTLRFDDGAIHVQNDVYLSQHEARSQLR